MYIPESPYDCYRYTLMRQVNINFCEHEAIKCTEIAVQSATAK